MLNPQNPLRFWGRQVSFSHGLAGNCGIGHCGYDSVDVRLASDATSATEFPNLRPLWLFGPFNHFNWPETIDRFPRPERGTPSDFGPKFLSCETRHREIFSNPV
jgi:hypothetical protein